ncbi:MAG: tRNA-specific adenosine deaminase subunit tad3 [Pleopsidium flavum]|nr:MAG: tRNA-specific adenosine deaminase subunit tad3 [Pleopsidium flavum]
MQGALGASKGIDHGQATSVEPKHGQLIPLKTTLESRSSTRTVDAHVVQIPTTSANTILCVLREEIPEQDAINLQHLRRFAKPDFLPDHLGTLLSSFDENINDNEAQENNHNGADDMRQAGGLISSKESIAEPSLHLLVCAASIIPSRDLVSILSSHPSFSDFASTPVVRTIPVPLLPPTSDEQAKAWSREYWPTVYKRNNPFGPHPSLVSRAEDEIRPQADKLMALATRVAAEVDGLAIGEPVGAVIVDRKVDEGPAVLAIAGDARWCGGGQGQESIQDGNIMAHAVMRAIGMIARQRRTLVTQSLHQEIPPTDACVTDTPEASEEDIFKDWPLTNLEKSYYSQTPITPNGYLCVDLEIYITHEPCIMCSMAINHSRFGRVVFGKRMPWTGGLTSESTVALAGSVKDIGERGGSVESEEGGLGYGLFWRRELNWKLLGWRWVGMDDDVELAISEDWHA